MLGDKSKMDMIEILMLFVCAAMAHSEQDISQNTNLSTSNKCDDAVLELRSMFLHLDDEVKELKQSTSDQRKTITIQNKELTRLRSRISRLEGEIPDRKNQFTSLGCLSDVIPLSCPDERLIYVTHAEYGQYHSACTEDCCAPDPVNDCSEDVITNAPEDWDILKYTCDNKTSCDYEYKGVIIPECEVDYVADYMQIFYDCTPDPAATVVGFTAWASEPRSYDGSGIVLFDKVDSNFGGHYQPSTSTFPCPYHATYMFCVNIVSDISSYMNAAIYRDSKLLAGVLADDINGARNPASALVITECSPGQTIMIRSTAPGQMYSHNGNRYSLFSGYLLQQLP